MKQVLFSLLCALVAFAVYSFADTNDFRVTSIAIEGDAVRVSWQCVGPSNYVLQASSTVTGSWKTVDSVFIVPNTLTITNIVDPNGATNLPAQFYRVRLSVPS